ncbi:MAG: hypothetical protein J1F07_05000 [Muribaculaceae bacterium]|nr:hypothetical protein [Muribaculaceae bacterium]
MYIKENIINYLRQINCEDLACRFGIEVKRHKAYCFLHSESVPSLSFHPSKTNVWHCFSCGKGGDAISFMMEYDRCGFIEACEKLCAIYGIILPTGKPSYIPKRRVSTRTFSNKDHSDCNKMFDTEIAEWLLNNIILNQSAKRFLFEKRKLNKEIICKIGVKSIDDSRSISQKIWNEFGEKRCRASGLFGEKGYLSFWTPCILFPYRDKNDQLLGLQSRYIGDNEKAPRFQFLSRQKTHLFNMPLLNEFTVEKDLYITEGVTDCLAMLSNGKASLAIPSATIIPVEDLHLLRGYKLKMMPDNDEAGWDGFMKLRRALFKLGIPIFKEDIPAEYKDYGEWYASEAINTKN